MFKKGRSRVFKELSKAAKDAQRIEVRKMVATYLNSKKVRYEIQTLEEDGTSKLLGSVYISPDGGNFYRASFTNWVNPIHDALNKIGSENSFEGAEALAYERASEIAQKIADANGTYVEDRVLEDEEAIEMDSFENRKGLPKISGLEGKTMLFTISIIAGLALSLSSLTATGYAVSNALGSGQGIGGIFLFVVGLVGMFFSLRKK